MVTVAGCIRDETAHWVGAVVPYLLISLVLAPVMEEVLYRHVLIAALPKRMTVGAAMFTSAIYFGLLHVAAYRQTGVPIVQALGGAITAAAYVATRSLRVPALIHSCANVLADALWLYAGLNI
jgi:hypothetical protein